MNNGEYWKKRFELLEQAAHQQGVQCYADIEKQYRQAQKQLEGQIAAWYQRFASNNGVTLAEAKRMLNAKELAELKWDVNQYIQYGQENAINGTWVKQLENASARFHISRLEALKLQIYLFVFTDKWSFFSVQHPAMPSWKASIFITVQYGIVMLITTLIACRKKCASDQK